jgi:sugar phosphate isomerase/epimerase
VQSVARWFEENALPPPSLHLPFEEHMESGHIREFSALAPDAGVRLKTIDEMKRCLEMAERIPLAYVVLHLGIPGQRFNPACFDYAYAAVAQIQAFSGVRVLIENIENSISTIERVHEFVTLTKLEQVGVCYDTVHGYASGDAAAFASAPAGLIGALQLRDCQGSERRLWPFAGNIPWPLFVEKLTISKFGGPLMFETEDGDLARAHDTQMRLEELGAEAENSMDEFRLKHRLPLPKTEEEE